MYFFVFAILITQLFASRAGVMHSFPNVKTTTPSDEQSQAVVDLIGRLIPKYVSKFEVVVDAGSSALDTFEYASNAEGKLVIRGTTGVAAAQGLQHFLKHFCLAHVSWSGDQLDIPEPFPRVNRTVRVTSPHRYSQCTVVATLYRLHTRLANRDPTIHRPIFNDNQGNNSSAKIVKKFLEFPIIRPLMWWLINNGTRTEWSPIRSVIIRVITKLVNY